MKIIKFEYTKKKDEKTKSYIISKLDTPDGIMDRTGGIDLSLLTEDEVSSLIKTQFEYHCELNKLIEESIKSGDTFKEMTEKGSRLESDYKDLLNPYIKKAYRLFINERMDKIHYRLSIGNVEDNECDSLIKTLKDEIKNL